MGQVCFVLYSVIWECLVFYEKSQKDFKCKIGEKKSHVCKI